MSKNLIFRRVYVKWQNTSRRYEHVFWKLSVQKPLHLLFWSFGLELRWLVVHAWRFWSGETMTWLSFWWRDCPMAMVERWMVVTQWEGCSWMVTCGVWVGVGSLGVVGKDGVVALKYVEVFWVFLTNNEVWGCGERRWDARGIPLI